MSYSYHHPPLSSSSSLPRQHKAITQRQYREKEVECFNALRDTIKELTGEEVQKRQEILKKATDLLLATSASRRQRSPILYEMEMLPFSTSPGDMSVAEARWGSFAQSPSNSSQTWPIDINTEFDPQFFDQQDEFMQVVNGLCFSTR